MNKIIHAIVYKVFLLEITLAGDFSVLLQYTTVKVGETPATYILHYKVIYRQGCKYRCYV